MGTRARWLSNILFHRYSLYSMRSKVDIEAEVAIIDQKQAAAELISKSPIAPALSILLISAKSSINSIA